MVGTPCELRRLIRTKRLRRMPFMPENGSTSQEGYYGSVDGWPLPVGEISKLPFDDLPWLWWSSSKFGATHDRKHSQQRSDTTTGSISSRVSTGTRCCCLHCSAHSAAFFRWLRSCSASCFWERHTRNVPNRGWRSIGVDRPSRTAQLIRFNQSKFQADTKSACFWQLMAVFKDLAPLGDSDENFDESSRTHAQNLVSPCKTRLPKLWSARAHHCDEFWNTYPKTQPKLTQLNATQR